MTGRLDTRVDPLTIADTMACVLAREIQDEDVLGVGLGTPLAVLAGLLARRTHAPLSHLLVGGAVDPDADFDTVLGGPAALAGRTAGYVPHLETMGMAESQQMTLQILRPAQIDGEGNLNTSRIGDRRRPLVRFPGGLATADVPKLLPRLVIYLPAHAARNLPERVACVTGSGRGWSWGPPSRGVTVLVTDLAVIEYRDGIAAVRSIHPWATPDEVRTMTGFHLTFESRLASTEPPSGQETTVLAELDPRGLRADELRGRR